MAMVTILAVGSIDVWHDVYACDAIGKIVGLMTGHHITAILKEESEVEIGRAIDTRGRHNDE